MTTHIRNAYEKAVRIFKSDKGQGLVEYALILVLIALVAMAGMTSLGTTVSSELTNIGTKLP